MRRRFRSLPGLGRDPKENCKCSVGRPFGNFKVQGCIGSRISDFVAYGLGLGGSGIRNVLGLQLSYGVVELQSVLLVTVKMELRSKIYWSLYRYPPCYLCDSTYGLVVDRRM